MIIKNLKARENKKRRNLIHYVKDIGLPQIQLATLNMNTL